MNKSLAFSVISHLAALCVWATFVPFSRMPFVIAALWTMMVLTWAFPIEDVDKSETLPLLVASLLLVAFVVAVVGWLTWVKVICLMVPVKVAISLLRRRLA